ncbi:DUF771 domain-containing protein [Staphylococcus rostri]|uniref:DUF771 domain-containing protein n=1 Tax=Staphylococcus rostri TaxID=522262 RepID=A0A2K3YNJ1_9STAP|nr:DUF771 domain-containing protein [Staphylococcus rostri]PNZ27183.1 DUF771 domain-containing protein [Staphylococcus rostri]
MTQTIQVTVPIPDTHILIEKQEYVDLMEMTLDPVWTMKDLKSKLKIASEDTIRRKFLENVKFYKELKEKGIVHYPDENFNRWRFNARKMNRFIDENFEEILKAKGGG